MVKYIVTTCDITHLFLFSVVVFLPRFILVVVVVVMCVMCVCV